MRCRIQIDSSEDNGSAVLTDFMESSLCAIDNTIILSTVQYPLMVVVLTYFLCRTFGSDGKKHMLSVIASTLLIFGSFFGLMIGVHAVLSVPFFMKRFVKCIF